MNDTAPTCPPRRPCRRALRRCRACHRAQEEGEDVREEPHVLEQPPPHPMRKGQRPLAVGHVRQPPLHQMHRRHMRALRVTGGTHPSSLAREGDEKLVLATLAAHPREAMRQHSALQVPGVRPAPRTGAGRAPPRSPPPAAWPGCPSPPRPAPSPPAASAGTPTRAPPPAPHLPHLARAHAPVRLPRGSREPWETGELRPLASKLLAPVGPHVPPV